MKYVVLDAPYVRFISMCNDIDRWLAMSLPKLDIENTSTGRHRETQTDSQGIVGTPDRQPRNCAFSYRKYQ